MSIVTPRRSEGTDSPSLTSADFASMARLLERHCGIQLRDGKEMLVRSRLAPRMRELGLTDVGQYLARVRGDGAELSRVVDLLTTNKTSLFREIPHFEFLSREILPALDRSRPFRCWSAGCSSGDEPYSLAMLWHEAAPANCTTTILATDISTRSLARARAAEYTADQLDDVDAERVTHHFQTRGGGSYVLREHVRAAVRFARLNLMNRWPMRGPFDLILCRNVMIYFSRETRTRLVRRYAELMRPGSHLFIGHAESLGGIDVPFEFVQPAIYRRSDDSRATGSSKEGTCR